MKEDMSTVTTQSNEDGVIATAPGSSMENGTPETDNIVSSASGFQLWRNLTIKCGELERERDAALAELERLKAELEQLKAEAAPDEEEENDEETIVSAQREMGFISTEPLESHSYDHHMGGGWGDRIEWSGTEQFSTRPIDPSSIFECNGWKSPQPRVGQTLRAEFVHSWVIFEFTEVNPCGNPRDMFFAKVRPVRRIPKPVKDTKL